MPLLATRHPFFGATLGLWLIAEEERFFRDDLPLSAVEEGELAPLKNKRRLEWLAGRWLLHRLTGAVQRIPLAKDAFSKPFFLDQPDLHCSLSHSHGVVGALLADLNCGCDVQVLVEKMTRLAPKFLSKSETEFVGQHGMDVQFDLLHIFWTAKESMYKAYGLKELDFRKNMNLAPFEWHNAVGQTIGVVEKSGFRQVFQLNFEKSALPEEAGTYVCTTCFGLSDQHS